MKSIKIKVNELVPDKEQPRKTIEGIKELGESLKSKGQLSPIVITKENLILDGHRRYFASKDAGIEYLDAVVIDDRRNLTPFLKKAYPFAVNIERHGFKAFDMAESICHVYWNYFLDEYEPKSRNDTGYSEFAKSMGIAKTQVNEIINTYTIAKKSPSLARALKRKEVAFSTLKEIAKSPVEEQQHYIDITLKEMEKSIPNRTHLRDMIRDEKSRSVLEIKNVLNRGYLGRIKSNSKNLISLLNPTVIKLGSKSQLEKIKESLKPIINFYNKF